MRFELKSSEYWLKRVFMICWQKMKKIWGLSWTVQNVGWKLIQLFMIYRLWNQYWCWSCNSWWFVKEHKTVSRFRKEFQDSRTRNFEAIVKGEQKDISDFMTELIVSKSCLRCLLTKWMNTLWRWCIGDELSTCSVKALNLSIWFVSENSLLLKFVEYLKTLL